MLAGTADIDLVQVSDDSFAAPLRAGNPGFDVGALYSFQIVAHERKSRFQTESRRAKGADVRELAGALQEFVSTCLNVLRWAGVEGRKNDGRNQVTAEHRRRSSISYTATDGNAKNGIS